MSRTAQTRKKEKRWKQTNRSRIERGRREADEIARMREKCHEQGLEFVEFEISHDAMPDPLIDALPEADRAEIAAIAEHIYSDVETMRGRLEALVVRHPHIPTLWNWLMISVGKAGDDLRTDELVEEIYRRFPKYLYGVSQWIMTLLDQDRVEEATRVLDGRLGPTAWWPERRRYHVTELVVFMAMLGCYFAAIGNLDAAKRQLEMVRDLLPEHPGVRSLEYRIARALMAPIG